jgi:hypothetical protein
MLRGVFAATVSLSILGGCTATNVQMANNKGQTARCSMFGAGLLGAPAAVLMTQSCVDEYKKQGYHEVPAGPPSPSAAASTSTPQATGR